MSYIHHQRRPPLYFWRETGGREVDVIIDQGATRLPIEIKAGHTVASDSFRELERYAKLTGCLVIRDVRLPHQS